MSPMAEQQAGCSSRNGCAPTSPSLTQFPKPDDTLVLLTIDPGKDIIAELSNFARACGALYTEKATGTVSSPTLYDPKLKTEHRFKGTYVVVSLYASLHEEDEPLEKRLWALLSNSAGNAFFGRASKPLRAESPVKVWIVR